MPDKNDWRLQGQEDYLMEIEVLAAEYEYDSVEQFIEDYCNLLVKYFKTETFNNNQEFILNSSSNNLKS